MEERETIEAELGRQGYGIQYTRESNGVWWQCSICHDSWWTNPYSDGALQVGEGYSQTESLVAAMIGANLSVRTETEA